MSDSRSHGLPSPGVCAGIVVAMLAMIAVPAAITLHAVHEPVPLVPVNQHSTPHGYTVSLLLFVFPIAVIAGWFLPRGGLHIPRRAFWRTLAILVPLGFMLDFVFCTMVLRLSKLRSNAGHSCSRSGQICAGRRVHLLPDRLSRSSPSVRVALRVLAGRLQHA